MIIELRDCAVDSDRLEVIRPDRVDHLTRTEAAVLVYLFEHAGRPISREECLKDVLGYRDGTSTRALDTVIYKLRQKVERDAAHPDHIIGLRSFGYRFDPVSSRAVAWPVAARSLPRATTPLEGRLEVLAQVAGRLRDERSVTLLGPAGIGKTRIALELAERSAVPVRWVDLEAASPLEALAKALGHPPPKDAAQLLASIDPGADALFVFDAADAQPGTAALVTALLATAPGACVLTTSRVRVRAEPEAVFDVPPLDLDEARALFTRCARRARGGVQLPPASDPGWETLWERIDGLPLAIELLAARIRVLDFAALVAADLSGPEATRRRSLRDAFDDAWAGLGSDARVLLADAGVFQAPFSLAAAEAVLGTSIVDGLLELADISLLRTIENELGVRFQVLRTVRPFLPQPSERARAGHLAWHLSQAPLQALGVGDPPAAPLAPSRKDFVSAAEGALAGGRIDAAARLLLAVHVEPPPRDASLDALVDRVLAAADLSVTQRFELLLARGSALLHHHQDPRAARGLLETALELVEGTDRARAHLALALHATQSYAMEDVLAHTDAALRLVTAPSGWSDPRIAAAALIQRATILGAHGEREDATAALDRAERALDGLDAPLLAGHLASERAALERRIGHPEEAIARSEEAIAHYGRSGRTLDLLMERVRLLYALTEADLLARSEAEATTLLERPQATGIPDVRVFALVARATARHRSGQGHQALADFEAARAVATRCGMEHAIAQIGLGGAAVCLDHGTIAEAVVWLERSRDGCASYPYMRATFEALRAHAMGELGRREELDDATRWLLELRGATRDPAAQARWLAHAGLGWARVDRRRARELLSDVDGIGSRHPSARALRDRLASSLDSE